MATPKKILIVEDEKSLSTALYTKLTRSGFDTSVCYDGEQAMETLTKEQFDLVLLDIVLPKKDGFKILAEKTKILAEKTKTINVDTPVIVITNLSEKEDLIRAKNLGARDCYVKSEISLNVVITNIMNVLGFPEGGAKKKK
jgi:DNA-binding response OmpR family regulator